MLLLIACQIPVKYIPEFNSIMRAFNRLQVGATPSAELTRRLASCNKDMRQWARTQAREQGTGASPGVRRGGGQG